MMGVLIGKNDVVLFQGDSITDSDRSRNITTDLGKGYALMAAALFTQKYPELHTKFINRGIGGDRVVDLQGRWKKDCLDLQPTWVSIYIGINDTWRRYDNNDPTTVEDFKAGYHDLLTQTKQKLNANLILVEPFVLPVPEDRKAWREDLDPKINAVRELAREFGALLVPLDGLFAQASTSADAVEWAFDGVHPTPAGSALIAKAWLETVGVKL
jgi:acyl-CoA thioesterase-1